MPDAPAKTDATAAAAAAHEDRASAPVDDNPSPPIVADARPAEPKPAGQDEERAEPPPNPRAARMKEIADRVKASRTDSPEYTGDYTDPAQTVGNITREPEPAEPAEPVAPAEPAAPAPQGKRRFRLKVDGNEFERDIDEVARLAEMTPEEVEQHPERATKYAQKELAASSRLTRANDILRGAHQRPADDPSRRAPGSQDEPRASATEPAPEPPATDVTQGDDDDIAKLVEDIQFGGDPKETAKRLRSAITKTARQESETATVGNRMQEDFAATMRAFEEFKGQNQDLVDDPNAHAVMKHLIEEGYAEDLRALGLPEDQIPKDPVKRADYHRYYRSQGHKVRPPDKMLNDVKSKYLDWRGGSKTPPAPTSPAPREGQPTVKVNRDARRQAIPTQPTRATAPPTEPAAVTPQPRRRSAVIQTMRRSRGQVTA